MEIKKDKQKHDKLNNYIYKRTVYKSNSFLIKEYIIKSKQINQQSQLNQSELITNSIFLREYIKEDFQKENKKDKFINEIRILKKIGSFDLTPNILFITKNETSIGFAYKYRCYMSLSIGSLLSNRGKFNLYESKFLLGNFLHLFHYLLERNVLYRGIDLFQVYLKFDGYIETMSLENCKLINNDNNGNYEVQKEDKIYSRAYTIVDYPQYLSPEIISSEGYDYRSNSFLIGILLYEFQHGYNPFFSKDPIEIYKNILNLKYKPIKCDRDGRLLIEKLFTYKEERLTFNQVCYDKFF